MAPSHRRCSDRGHCTADAGLPGFAAGLFVGDCVRARDHTVAAASAWVLIPAARRADWYARRVGVAAARKINKIPAARRPTNESRLRAAGMRRASGVHVVHPSGPRTRPSPVPQIGSTARIPVRTAASKVFDLCRCGQSCSRHIDRPIEGNPNPLVKTQLTHWTLTASAGRPMCPKEASNPVDRPGLQLRWLPPRKDCYLSIRAE